MNTDYSLNKDSLICSNHKDERLPITHLRKMCRFGKNRGKNVGKNP